jgi:uracil phosphoribosyltransferase
MKKDLLLEELVLRIRDPATGRKEFRESLERIGEHLGHLISHDFRPKPAQVTTVLGKDAVHWVPGEEVALVGVLRAGLPLLYGLQRAFPDAETGFIGAMRDEQTLKATLGYAALPDLKDRTVVLADTMLATGGSVIDCLKVIEARQPRRLIVATAIASQEGLDRVVTAYPQVSVYRAAVDPELNVKGFIVPGLGDAGDRAYGKKTD